MMTVFQDREYQMGYQAYLDGQDRDEDESLDWLTGWDDAEVFEQ